MAPLSSVPAVLKEQRAKKNLDLARTAEYIFLVQQWSALEQRLLTLARRRAGAGATMQEQQAGSDAGGGGGAGGKGAGAAAAAAVGGALKSKLGGAVAARKWGISAGVRRRSTSGGLWVGNGSDAAMYAAVSVVNRVKVMPS